MTKMDISMLSEFMHFPRFLVEPSSGGREWECAAPELVITYLWSNQVIIGQGKFSSVSCENDYHQLGCEKCCASTGFYIPSA